MLTSWAAKIQRLSRLVVLVVQRVAKLELRPCQGLSGVASPHGRRVRDGGNGRAKMPSRVAGANRLVEAKLTTDLVNIEKLLDADCLTYVGSIAFGADDDIRDAVEAISDKKSKLVCI